MGQEPWVLGAEEPWWDARWRYCAARDASGREVVLALPVAPDDDMARLAAEVERGAAVLMALRHPGLPRVLGVTRVEGLPALVLAPRPGRSALEWAMEERPSLETRVRLAAQLCAAVEHLNGFCDPTTGRHLARDHGLIHPDGLCIDEDGEGCWRALAWPRLGGGGLSPVMGNPRYVPVFAMERGGVQADVAALGIWLYELLSGQHPFEADSVVGMLGRMMLDAATPLSARLPGVPEGLSELVGRALARDGRARFKTPGALGLALEAFLAGGAFVRAVGRDEALERLRVWVYEGRLPEVVALLETHPALAQDPTVGGYALAHFEALLMGPLRRGAPMPRRWEDALAVMPMASEALVAVLTDEASSEGSRVVATRVLGRIGAGSSGEVVAALKGARWGHSLWLDRAAWEALVALGEGDERRWSPWRRGQEAVVDAVVWSGGLPWTMRADERQVIGSDRECGWRVEGLGARHASLENLGDGRLLVRALEGEVEVDGVSVVEAMLDRQGEEGRGVSLGPWEVKVSGGRLVAGVIG